MRKQQARTHRALRGDAGHLRALYQALCDAFPSKKAVARERAKLQAMTDSHRCFQPIATVLAALHRHLRGWTNYFSYGDLRSVFYELDRYLAGRLMQHLQRRSQRPYRPPPGVGWYPHLRRLGLRQLAELAHA